MTWYQIDWLLLCAAMGVALFTRPIGLMAICVYVAELAAGGTGLEADPISMMAVDLGASVALISVADHWRDRWAAGVMLIMSLCYFAAWAFGWTFGATGAIVDGINYVMMVIASGFDLVVPWAIREINDRLGSITGSGRVGLFSLEIRRAAESGKEDAPQVAGRRWS